METKVGNHMEGYAHIESNPEICAEQPHIKGTRITVSLIAREVENLRMTPDEVVAAHAHLTLAQIHAALAYFYDHREEIERDVQATDAVEAQLRAQFPSHAQALMA